MPSDGTPTVSGGTASGNNVSARWLTRFVADAIVRIVIDIPTAGADFTLVGASFWDGATRNGYVVYLKEEVVNAQLVIARVNAGVSSDIGNAFISQPSYPCVYEVAYNPATDTFEVVINGVSQTTFTDATHQNLTHPGFRLTNGTHAIDTFNAWPMAMTLPDMGAEHPKAFVLRRS